MTDSCLRRYTTLPFLLDILEKKRLTLSDPERWEDKNDYAYLQAYRVGRDLQSLRVLCFADAPELFSHWKVYAGNSSGVCIEFDRVKLLEHIPDNNEVRQGYTNYETIRDQGARQLTLDELPFTKRYGYMDDREFRVVACSKQHSVNEYIPISLDCISMIIFSPWMTQEIALSVKRVIEKIHPECQQIKVRHSTLFSSRRWMKKAKSLSQTDLAPKKLG